MPTSFPGRGINCHLQFLARGRQGHLPLCVSPWGWGRERKGRLYHSLPTGTAPSSWKPSCLPPQAPRCWGRQIRLRLPSSI